MNTNKIKNTELLRAFNFIEVKGGKVLTANYLNVLSSLSSYEQSVLNFIIKESTVWNTVKRPTALSIKYKAYVKAIEDMYRVSPSPSNIHIFRQLFIRLIQKGLIVRCGNEYVINFCLCYSPQFKAPAIRFMKKYSADITDKRLKQITEETLNEIKK